MRTKPKESRDRLTLTASLSLLLCCSSCSVDQPGGPAVVPIPFFVSDYFVPTGFMGDAAGLQLDIDNVCRVRREGAGGSCYRVVFEPTPEGPGWAGIYFQYPENNWGERAGRRVSPGATRLIVRAATEAGGESVTFRAGGLAGETPDGLPLPYSDTVAASQTFTLSTNMTDYAVPLPEGATYDQVYGAFGFSLQGSTDKVVLFLDEVRWE